jgi:hypothetical protein
MNDSFFKYIQQLETFAFFSGYPIVYAIAAFIRGNKLTTGIRNTIFILTPFAYAIVGVLYLGLQLKKYYPNYSLAHLVQEIQNPFLTVWAFSSLLFWMPALNKRPIISLLHSLVFFFVIAKNFYTQIRASESDNNIIKNYIRVYSDSILLNSGVLISLLIIYLTIRRIKKKSVIN